MGRRRPRRASVLRAEIAIAVVAPHLKCHLLPNVLDKLEPFGLLSDQLLDVHHAFRVVAGDPLDVGNRHAVSSLEVCRVSRRIPRRSITYSICLRPYVPQCGPFISVLPAAPFDSNGHPSRERYLAKAGLRGIARYCASSGIRRDSSAKPSPVA